MVYGQLIDIHQRAAGVYIFIFTSFFVFFSRLNYDGMNNAITFDKEEIFWRLHQNVCQCVLSPAYLLFREIILNEITSMNECT